MTTIYVTHDQVEAMTMGHRVAVMRKGELQQVAPPQELYDSPVNVFVGGFIGSPAMNMLEARIERANGGLAAVLGETRLALDDETLSRRPALAAYEGREVVLGIRPEDLDDAALANGDRRPRLTGRVEMREALGSEVLVHFTIAAPQAVTDDVRELAEDVGDDRARRTSSPPACSRTRRRLVGPLQPADAGARRASRSRSSSTSGHCTSSTRDGPRDLAGDTRSR